MAGGPHPSVHHCSNTEGSAHSSACHVRALHLNVPGIAFGNVPGIAPGTYSEMHLEHTVEPGLQRTTGYSSLPSLDVRTVHGSGRTGPLPSWIAPGTVQRRIVSSTQARTVVDVPSCRIPVDPSVPGPRRSVAPRQGPTETSASGHMNVFSPYCRYTWSISAAHIIYTVRIG